MTEVRRNNKGEKLYPFSMRKYGHNIELAYNHQKNICDEMEDGERAVDRKAFEHLQKLSDAYATAIGHPVAWVNGKTYAVLKDASAWAESYRDERRTHERS